MKKKKQSKTSFEDDDMRVIAPMNVEGMPGYVPRAKEGTPTGPLSELDPVQAKEYRGAVLKAALLVGSVFAVACALFILFCVYIWFR